MPVAYQTDWGVCYQGSAESLLQSKEGQNLIQNVDLILTSPPFPLNRKKKYGNRQGQQYVDCQRPGGCAPPMVGWMCTTCAL